MKPIYLLFFFLSGIISSGLSQANIPRIPASVLLTKTKLMKGQSNIIPTPSSIHTIDNETLVFNQLMFSSQDCTPEEIDVVQSWLWKTFPMMEHQLGKPLEIRFIRREGGIGKDYYTVETFQEFILIEFTSDASKLYAMSSLIQLMEQSDNNLYLPGFKLVDHANFSWRGLHLDVSRHFFTVDEVKRYIDVMAFYKFNTFHWHLTDDQGWRIEIKKYPLLTEIGGFRDSTVNNHYGTVPRTWNTSRYGGSYTQEDIKDVVKYARKRGVTIVPEIEMPGHARAALAAYPYLSCTQEQLPVEGLWGVFDDIFCSKEETISFLQDILTEILELFPSEYIHIGGDEAPKTRWKACEKCQDNIKKYDLKDEHELQSWFVQQMDQFLTERGRKLIGWDEILEGGLSPNAAVMSWRGEEGGIEAANQQHEVVMSPVSHCYFDHYQGESRSEPLAFGGFTPLEKVYDFTPIPRGTALLNTNKKYILGAQANVWTEYISDFKQVEYMVFPRALAMIQNLWVMKHKPEYNEFLAILKEKQLDILKAWDVNYSLTFAKPKFEVTKSDNGITVKTSPETAYLKSELRQDGTISYLEDKEWDFDRNINGVERLKIEAVESEFNAVSFLDLTQHKGLGLNIEIVTPPNSSYSNNKEFALVDGILGSRPWSGSQWLGFNNGKVELIVTLDNSVTYKAVTVSTLNATYSWIHLPKEITVYTSNKGKKWKETAQQRVVGELTNIQLKGKAKLLKFVIHPMDKIPEGFPGAGYKPFTFLDELIFE